MPVGPRDQAGLEACPAGLGRKGPPGWAGCLLSLPLSLQLCMVSLSLFRTLLSLHCEDVLLQVVLR